MNFALPIALLLINVISTTKLPANMQKCSLKDEKLPTCLTKAINHALTDLGKGNQKLGIPQMDPLKVPMFKTAPGKTVSIELVYQNVEVHGLCHGNITDVKIDLKAKQLSLYNDLHFLKLTGQYEGNGKVLLLPVYGKGASEIYLSDVKAEIHFSLDIYEKNGIKYLEVLRCNCIIEPKRASYSFGNLFNGNQQLSEIVHKVINENWKVVFDDVKSEYEIVFAHVFKALANSLFDRVPLSELFNN